MRADIRTHYPVYQPLACAGNQRSVDVECRDAQARLEYEMTDQVGDLLSAAKSGRERFALGEHFGTDRGRSETDDDSSIISKSASVRPFVESHSQMDRRGGRRVDAIPRDELFGRNTLKSRPLRALR